MFSAILILLTLPFTDLAKQRGLQFRPISRMAFYIFVGNFLILMILGARHVEDPFIVYGQISTVLYFSYFLIAIPLITLFENSFNDMTTNNKVENKLDQEVEESILSGTPSYAGISSSVFNLSGSGIQKRQFSSTSNLSNKYLDRIKQMRPLKSPSHINKIKQELKLENMSSCKLTFQQMRTKVNEIYVNRSHSISMYNKTVALREKTNVIACYHADRADAHGTEEERLHYLHEGIGLENLEYADNVDIPGKLLEGTIASHSATEAVFCLVAQSGYLTLLT